MFLWPICSGRYEAEKLTALTGYHRRSGGVVTEQPCPDQIVLPSLERVVYIVVISHAPPDRLEAFKKRMGWSFKWISAGENGFNYDYYVSFGPEQIAKGEVVYNYATTARTVT